MFKGNERKTKTLTHIFGELWIWLVLRITRNHNIVETLFSANLKSVS